MAEPNDIPDVIEQVLNQTGVRFFGRRDSEWTLEIHSRLEEIGHQRGLSVLWPRKRVKAKTQCDCDHIWQDGNAIVLALEIEWGFGTTTLTDKITGAFPRLVACRDAQLRTMVCPVNGDAVFPPPAFFELVAQSGATRKGDRYLFCGWRSNRNRWEYDFYVR